MDIFIRGNDALTINTAVGVGSVLSEHGSDWLWAVVAVHIVAFLGMVFFSFTFPESRRVFVYNFVISLLVGSVAYFAQAANLGWSVVDEGGVTRQLFYARYIYWTVSFPSVALALGLLSGVSWTTIFCNIFLAWIWVLTYLAAAYTTTSYKWGFFAFGTLCWLVLALSTLNESREEAERRGISRDYMVLAVLPNALWILYPVAFGLSDGGKVIGVTGGAIFFGVLDVVMIPVLSFLFVAVGRRWDWEQLELAVSEFRGEGRGRVHPVEKAPADPSAEETGIVNEM